jgi:hypothetical protein
MRAFYYAREPTHSGASRKEKHMDSDGDDNDLEEDTEESI